MPVANHGRPRLSVGQRHAHGHQGAGVVRGKSGFNMVVGCWVGQVHAPYMNDPAEGLQFQIFAGHMKASL
jgi:hypothetical protein